MPGGDGTVNEVASVLAGTNTILGILPSGSGNGFAMHLGLGRDAIKAFEILKKKTLFSLILVRLMINFLSMFLALVLMPELLI
ncbi:MAG: acylglycerol kinase family protein [Saprospiraceae bacterium]|nr:acylglycerol kinase family protein [Saprospiraceae bacterium]